VATATITAKGQITIPKAVRQALGLDRGDQVVFVLEDGRAVLHPVRRRGVQSVRGIARGRVSYAGRAAEREAARRLVAEHAAPRAHE
jgi:AbrB family looped-hinge helix DNA binding protein